MVGDNSDWWRKVTGIVGAFPHGAHGKGFSFFPFPPETQHSGHGAVSSTDRESPAGYTDRWICICSVNLLSLSFLPPSEFTFCQFFVSISSFHLAHLVQKTQSKDTSSSPRTFILPTSLLESHQSCTRYSELSFKPVKQRLQ